MSNLEQLKKDYEQLGETIKRLEEGKSKAEWPKRGDRYWFIRSDTFVLPPLHESTWNDDPIDQGRKSVGNIFRTRKEAEREYEMRKTIAELRAQPGGKKFVVDENKYFLSVSLVDNNVFTDCRQYSELSFASTYFESIEATEAAIKAVGAERILAASKWLAMGE